VDALDPALGEEGRDATRILCIRHEQRALQVLVVDGEELLLVKLAVAPSAGGPIELGDELFPRENLFVSARPAKAHQIVQDRQGGVPLVSVFAHAYRAMTFRELLAAG